MPCVPRCRPPINDKCFIDTTLLTFPKVSMPSTIGHTKHLQAHRLVSRAVFIIKEALSTMNSLAVDVNWTRQILSKLHEMFMHTSGLSFVCTMRPTGSLYKHLEYKKLHTGEHLQRKRCILCRRQWARKPKMD